MSNNQIPVAPPGKPFPHARCVLIVATGKASFEAIRLDQVVRIVINGKKPGVLMDGGESIETVEEPLDLIDRWADALQGRHAYHAAAKAAEILASLAPPEPEPAPEVETPELT